MITNITLVLGMILGSLLLTAAVYVYVKHQVFALGGSVLTLFGTLLLGLSIWQSVELKIGPKGDMSATFRQDLGATAAGINHRIAQLELKLSEISEYITLFRNRFPEVRLSQEAKAIRTSKEQAFKENSNYSVLVFYKSQNEKPAEKIEAALLSDGYKSSSTASDLREAVRQFPARSAWIIYTKNGESKLNDVRKILDSLNLNFSLHYEPQPARLRNGDIQILLF